MVPFPLTHLPSIELISLERFNQLDISQIATTLLMCQSRILLLTSLDREWTRGKAFLGGLSENHYHIIMVRDPPIRHGLSLNNFNVLNENNEVTSLCLLFRMGQKSGAMTAIIIHGAI